MPLHTIVFDLDDTLYPEHQYVHSGFRAVDAWLEQEQHIAGFYRVVSDLFDAGKRGHLFDEALDALGQPITPARIHHLITVYRTHSPILTLFPETQAVLAACTQQWHVSIITDGYLEVQQRKVAALQLADIVPHIVYSDTYGRACWKPHPKPYEAVMAHWHAPPENCIYIGDNPLKDFIGARRLGWQTIRVRRPGTEHAHRQPQPGYAADHEMTNLQDVMAWLQDHHTDSLRF